MKITSFNPLILTKDADSKIKLFEEMGFEKRHCITIDESGTDITTVRMKHADGFYVDISQSDEMQQDMMMIRMNVRDFEEAYQFLLSKGFQNPRGEEHQIETRTNKSACLIAPSGFAFNLCQHIKNEKLSLEQLELVSGGCSGNVKAENEPYCPWPWDYSPEDEEQDKGIMEAIQLSISHNVPFNVALKAVELAKNQGISAEQALKQLGY